MACKCGYEPRTSEESRMLETYGCAKTVVKRYGPFNSLELIQCPINTQTPIESVIDGPEFFEAYKKSKFPNTPQKEESKEPVEEGPIRKFKKIYGDQE